MIDAQKSRNRATVRPALAGRAIGPDWQIAGGENAPMSAAFHDKFRARLRAVRDELDYSQLQMATALDVTEKRYKGFEYKTRFPIDLLEKLALITHKDLDFWITGRARRGDKTNGKP